MSSKIFYCTKVVAYGILCIITKLEFFQHHFFETGHRNTSCDPHLHPSLQATNACTASREASAAGRLRPNAVIAEVRTSPNLSDFPTNHELVHNAVSRVRFKSPENADFGHL